MLTIFLVSSCQNFSWEPRPFVADHATQSIYRDKEQLEIKCSDPAFNNYIAFHFDNIVDLKAEIDRVNKKKDRKRLQKAFDSAMAGFNLPLR